MKKGEMWIHRILLLLIGLGVFYLLNQNSMLKKQSLKHEQILSKIKIMTIDKSTYEKMFKK